MAADGPSIIYDVEGRAVAGIFEPALEFTACVVAAALKLEHCLPLPNSSGPRWLQWDSNEVSPSYPLLENLLQCYNKHYGAAVRTFLISKHGFEYS